MALPLPEISVRLPGRDAGGPAVPARGMLPPAGGAVFLLVHGYANSASDARESWSAFLDDLAAARLGGWLPRNPTGVQWPGDEPIVGINQASYPLKIEVAVRSAGLVADFLTAAAPASGPRLTLSVAAHSLGCRLAVELLRELAARPDHGVVVDRVVLMAAAVPTGSVDRDGPLRPGVFWTRGVQALYSAGDDVLRFAFPIGETAGGDGFFPTAVGRHGDPGSTWLSARQMNHGGKLYGHGDYWRGTESAAAAAAFLGIPVAASIPVRATVANDLVDGNAIAGRAIGARSIAARSLAA